MAYCLSQKNIPIWRQEDRTYENALRSKAILTQICFLDHKRCCLGFNLLGLCLAVEKSVNGHAQIANMARY